MFFRGCRPDGRYRFALFFWRRDLRRYMLFPQEKRGSLMLLTYDKLKKV